MTKTTRRQLLQTGGTLAALSILPMPALGTSESKKLNVLVGGGDWAKANIAAYVEPFQDETGIKINAISDQVNLAQVELMARSGNVAVDVISYGQSGGETLHKRGVLEDIDYSLYGETQKVALADFAKKPFGVAALVYSYVMVLNTKTFPKDGPRPGSWGDYWDLERFPGIRTLMSGRSGTEGPWEEASMASGDGLGEVYPMDIDRIFTSLDKVKTEVRRWWTVGSEIQQIMHDGAFDVTNSYDGRAQLLINEGAEIEIVRNQAKLNWDYWMIPKGSPNLEAAQRFIQFATRADRQAEFAQLIPYGPSNLNAYKSIPEERARQLASHPDYVANSIPIKASWYTAARDDGRSNVEHLIERWNKWSL
ncbi:ABC transporter substrate-binding protein [Roseovarius sp. 217]|uniref:ABC transporter substrate-binding protein n=1 Tax=Roseovarius sp. (strain 217) TaxID=314264 RepID=UPI0000685B37|nr:ABC transporter substrate-binding protein [Roseovarius sp. 217]EAQ26817.1 ABC transporter, binding protein component [Roseovarius sp. 217]